MPARGVCINLQALGYRAKLFKVFQDSLPRFSVTDFKEAPISTGHRLARDIGTNAIMTDFMLLSKFRIALIK